MGSIPARAGEPLFSPAANNVERVYPRPRGGAPTLSCRTCAIQGLSPPARGSRVCHRVLSEVLRSIPARAGEPLFSPAANNVERVYPRPRGGAFPPRLAMLMASGLSPPARGSRCPIPTRRRSSRSIPARAGEPSPTSGEPEILRVYPRPRGGASSAPSRTQAAAGLSPPARGSRIHITSRIDRHGSIPARAGEPPAERF